MTDENAQKPACTGQEAASRVKAEYRDGWTPSDDAESERQPVGPFDALDLADVDDLPVCCICGKTIVGMPQVDADVWYCEKAPKCRGAQGELGI